MEVKLNVRSRNGEREIRSIKSKEITSGRRGIGRYDIGWTRANWRLGEVEQIKPCSSTISILYISCARHLSTSCVSGDLVTCKASRKVFVASAWIELTRQKPIGGLDVCVCVQEYEKSADQQRQPYNDL